MLKHMNPEILSLLLQISDRPVDRSKSADLALLKPDIPSASLTWADIVAEDSIDDEDGTWGNVDFASDDSDDDEATHSICSDHSVLTPEFSVADTALKACIETIVEPTSDISVEEIQTAQ